MILKYREMTEEVDETRNNGKIGLAFFSHPKTFLYASSSQLFPTQMQTSERQQLFVDFGDNKLR